MPPPETALHDQTQLLPRRQLLIVFATMSLALLVCFVDQNGIGVLLPSIARDLHAGSSISWAGTSALLANTVFQVLYGRLSDLFGRKRILLSALALLALADLACGLADGAAMLYVFRALAGVANGGITSLSMMIVSDVVTLQERGKYQGILGVMVGLGNAVGPLIAAGFDQGGAGWRALFYLLAPVVAVTVVVSWWYLPTNMPRLKLRETVAMIDVWGLVFGSAAVILLLIPISEGGHAGTPWDSPAVVAMLTVGAVCLVVFVLVEWKYARLPMMPIDLFKNPSVCAMLVQSFLLGASYYSYLYFLPLYFQNVRHESVLISACLQLPLVAAQCPASVFGGLYMSRYQRYAEVIWSGFGIWTLGAGLLILADRTLSFGWIALFLVLIGIGTGFCFQPTLVAMQAHCSKAQRAVVTSNRNFLRSSGGAVGLAVSSAILANVLKASLPERLASVANSTFVAPSLSQYSAADRDLIADAYANASRAVFIFCAPLAGVCLLLCYFIRDRGLTRAEEKEEASRQGSTEENYPRGISKDVEQVMAGELDQSEKSGHRIESGLEEKDPSYRGHSVSSEKSEGQ